MQTISQKVSNFNKHTKSILAKSIIFSMFFWASTSQAFLGFGEEKAQEVSFSAVILSYGAISDATAPSKSTPPAVFAKQIQDLQNKGFTIWRLSDVMRGIQKRAKLPSKLAAITFDGGYKSVIETAFPILEKNKIPFTVFISKDFADYKSYLKNPLYMDMQDLLKLKDSKLVEFGNGSLGFETLAQKRDGESNEDWSKRVVASIDENGEWIKTNFGQTRLFAYPQGEVSAELESLIKKKRLFGFTKTDGVASLYSGLTKIPRFDLTGLGKDMSSFNNKLIGVPFPLKGINYPNDDILATNPRPMLQIEIYAGKYRIDRLRCFDGKGYDIPFSQEYIKSSKTYKINIRAEEDLKTGASYNCIMPHESQSRLFWFSKKFL